MYLALFGGNYYKSRVSMAYSSVFSPVDLSAPDFQKAELTKLRLARHSASPNSKTLSRNMPRTAMNANEQGSHYCAVAFYSMLEHVMRPLHCNSNG